MNAVVISSVSTGALVGWLANRVTTNLDGRMFPNRMLGAAGAIVSEALLQHVGVTARSMLAIVVPVLGSMAVLPTIRSWRRSC